jgi:hypothetical protein
MNVRTNAVRANIVRTNVAKANAVRTKLLEISF